MRWELQLDPVGALADNTAVLERARALAANRGREPKTSSVLPREALLELIAAAGKARARFRRP